MSAAKPRKKEPAELRCFALAGSQLVSALVEYALAHGLIWGRAEGTNSQWKITVKTHGGRIDTVSMREVSVDE